MSKIPTKFKKINERWKGRPAEPASPEFQALIGLTPQTDALEAEDGIFRTKWFEEFSNAFLEGRRQDTRRRERERERYLRRKAQQ